MATTPEILSLPGMGRPAPNCTSTAVPAPSNLTTSTRDWSTCMTRLCPRRSFAALTATLLLGLTACAGGDSASDDGAQLAALLDAAPPFQRDLMKDGVVTRAEYEKAVIANRDCVLAAGYQPGPLLETRGELGFETVVNYDTEPDPEAADRAFLATTDKCLRDHNYYVSQLWGIQLHSRH